MAGRWANVKEALITLGPGIYGGWSDPLTTDLITLGPGIYGGWSDPLKTVELTLEPSEEIYAGWKRVTSADIALSLEGGQPCLVDADCPEGYVCDNGVCVREVGTSMLPWVIAGVSAAAVGIILVTTREKRNER